MLPVGFSLDSIGEQVRFTWRWESDENRLEPPRPGSPPPPSLDKLMGRPGAQGMPSRVRGLGPCALRQSLGTYCPVSQGSPGTEEETGKDPAPKKQ